jgi:apyrase
MAARPVAATVLLLSLQLAWWSSSYPGVQVLADAAVLGRKAGGLLLAMRDGNDDDNDNDNDKPVINAESSVNAAAAGPGRYAVIFDAGSTGTRMHVFRFDNHMDLVGIGHGIEFFAKVYIDIDRYIQPHPIHRIHSIWRQTRFPTCYGLYNVVVGVVWWRMHAGEAWAELIRW